MPISFMRHAITLVQGLFITIRFVDWTNIFSDLARYIMQFRQIQANAVEINDQSVHRGDAYFLCVTRNNSC